MHVRRSEDQGGLPLWCSCLIAGPSVCDRFGDWVTRRWRRVVLGVMEWGYGGSSQS